MDMTVPYYETMELVLPDKALFVITLRSELVWAREKYLLGSWDEALVARVLEKIESAAGTPVRQRFEDWSVYEFADFPADHPHTLAWQTILNWCSGSPTRWRRLHLSPERSATLRHEFRRVSTDRDLEELYSPIDVGNLSAWDAETLRLRGDLDDPVNPLSWVAATIVMTRFKDALGKMIATLSETELVEFWRSAQAVGTEEGLTSIANLRHPGDLHEAGLG